MDRLLATRHWAATNWFLMLLPLLALVSYGFSQSIDWSQEKAAEAAILFDWCLFVPALFYLCYRKKLGGKQLAIRILAIFCLGVYLASKLVPVGAQVVLPHLSWLRSLGLAVLLLIEIRIVFVMVKLAFSGDATAARISESSGAPPLIARLMLLEARFWKRFWKFLRGR